MSIFKLWEIDPELFKIADDLFFVHLDNIYEYYYNANTSDEQPELPKEVQQLINNFMVISGKIDVVYRLFTVMDAIRNGCPVEIAKIWYFNCGYDYKITSYLWDDYLLNTFFLPEENNDN